MNNHEELQKRANSLTMRLFRRRFRTPSRTLGQLSSELRKQGLVRVRVHWLRAAAIIEAELGQELRSTIAQCRLIDATEIVYSGILGAARKAGFAPLYEDLAVQIKRGKIFSTLDAVPLLEITDRLDRDFVNRTKEKPRRRNANSRS